MVSIEGFTATFLMWPGFILFILLLVPLPIIPTIASKIVTFLGTPLTVYRFNMINTIAVIATLMFLNDIRIHFARYHDGVTPTFTNIGMEMEYKAKKWKLERDLYMAGTTCVLYFALNAIAGLKRELAEVTAKAVGDKKKN